MLAALFPVAFLASSFVLQRTAFQTSISFYYWTHDPERNVFVGTLCAIAVFLVLYKGYTRLEDWVLNLAGTSAAGVAFFPMDRMGDCSSSGFSAHGVFAVTFFACIFYVCIFMSGNSLPEMHNPIRERRFRIAYRWCSGAMITSVVIALLSRFLPREWTQSLCEQSAIFWFEAIGIWSFSAFWYIKTRELDQSRSWIPFRVRHASTFS